MMEENEQAVPEGETAVEALSDEDLGAVSGAGTVDWGTVDW